MARPNAPETDYREGYLHGRTSEAQHEEARNLRGQANAINAATAANAGNNLAIGLLLGLLAIGAILGFYVYTQANNPTAPAIEREINNTENNTTIDRTIERTQELVPVPQQTSAPEAPAQIVDPNPVNSN